MCRALQEAKKDFTLQLLLMALDDKNPGSMEFDLEHASLFLTLRKAWSVDAPRNLALFLLRVHFIGTGREMCSFESVALAVVHLLPVLVRCGGARVLRYWARHRS